MSVTESEILPPILNAPTEAKDSAPPVLRSRAEYEEYFRERLEAALHRAAAFLVEHVQQVDWKYWVALEPHQQQLIISSIRNKYPPDAEQKEAYDDNFMEETAQSLLIYRIADLEPRPPPKTKKAPGTKGSLLFKATQGDKMMKDFTFLSSGSGSTD